MTPHQTYSLEGSSFFPLGVQEGLRMIFKSSCVPIMFPVCSPKCSLGSQWVLQWCSPSSPMCFSRGVPNCTSLSYCISFAQSSPLLFSSHLWAKGEAWILTVVILFGEPPKFHFPFWWWVDKNDPIARKNKIKKKNRTWEQPFFLFPEIMRKKRNSKFKIQKKSDFGVFQSPEVRKTIIKNRQIFYTLILNM